MWDEIPASIAFAKLNPLITEWLQGTFPSNFYLSLDQIESIHPPE